MPEPSEGDLAGHVVVATVPENPGVRPPDVGSKAALSASAMSIFHEAWWLDLATGKRWQEVRVERGGAVLGWMPYFVKQQGLWLTSTMPALTRTLGPVIHTRNSNAAVEFRSRLSIAGALIDLLPDFVHFVQMLDPRLEEAIAFHQRGYDVSMGYTFWIARGRAKEETWSGMRDKTRNLIRRAGEQLTVSRIGGPDDFCSFYCENLQERQLANVYGSEVMAALIGAAISREAGCVLGAFDAAGNPEAMVVLVWDDHAVYLLLSTRRQSSHGGAVSLLVWESIQIASAKGLVFDFDGFAEASGLSFVTGFGGSVKPRIIIKRTRPWYAVIRSAKRRLASLPQLGGGISKRLVSSEGI